MIKLFKLLERNKNTNRTEIAIINSFWQLLEEKPYNKITVKNIVDLCQINRNTFYYHFQSIPELLERVLKQEADDIIKNHNQFESVVDCLTPVIQSCLSRRKAFLNIYHSVERDIFLNSLDRLTLYFVEKYINVLTEDLPIQPHDKSLLIRFYKSALVGIFLDWLDKNMSYDFVEAFSRISNLFAGSSDRALIRSTIKK